MNRNRGRGRVNVSTKAVMAEGEQKPVRGLGGMKLRVTNGALGGRGESNDMTELWQQHGRSRNFPMGNHARMANRQWRVPQQFRSLVRQGQRGRIGIAEDTKNRKNPFTIYDLIVTLQGIVEDELKNYLRSKFGDVDELQAGCLA